MSRTAPLTIVRETGESRPERGADVRRRGRGPQPMMKLCVELRQRLPATGQNEAISNKRGEFPANRIDLRASPAAKFISTTQRVAS